MLKERLAKYNIILASGSPRRQQFLRDLDVDFELRLKEIDEVYPAHLQEVEITDFLAALKADAFEGELTPKDILITSDTIVWHEGQALGKPADYDDAVRILSSLSGKTHTVVTSVCFKTIDKTELVNDRTLVTFNRLSVEAIEYYLGKYKPFDKAGAYGIQDWIGHIGVSRIEGSYANVMGLPVDKVFNYLTNLK